MDIISFATSSFVQLLVVVNPFVVVPFSIALTAHLSPNERWDTSVRACVIAFLIMALFALFGQSLLDAIGVTASALKIAGGILLFLVAYSMISGGGKSSSKNSDEPKQDVSVFPLAFPFICGPGALTVIGACVTNATTAGVIVTKSVMVVVILAVSAIMLFSLAAQDIIAKALGESGKNLCQRLFGLLLAMMGVQLTIAGVDSINRPSSQAYSSTAPVQELDRKPS
ncbi:MarC family protein [Candidatus Hydrogenosomobacter endosymbioticus]|uniref:UPF0056 membrane protein n=1 Tax=Candidatus Hydrogenosomobacter endosymbioticus TaxID=2558174 RepID=A0ABN6L328_9PROT|nr:MarC family protein [Candidatus Hydrogenosomobacter endosymbioticus]BDB96321.1 UPF0056 inner membrane protein [Candidatus Hydrogenosomobacter endosymbioticus]